ncbi:Gfo/Idh/MocA family oxidoreductase [Crocinitomix catalasitica]|nr:Gfo/Idh/MocA family oxidoreductase [Crocinitomix catalasitica]
MKLVIIGSSGHVEYAIKAKPQEGFAAFAPGSADEDVQTFYDNQLKESGTKFYDSYIEMLDAEHADLAVINPHYYLNGAITIECLKRGMHCFVEKPLSLNLNELAEIKDLHENGSAQLCTMMDYRYNHSFVAAYECIQNGMIGQPLLVTAQKSYKMGNKPEWTHSREKFGGLISWVGSHAIDWIYWMLGDEFEEVTANQTTVGNKGFGELESSALCFYRLKNGGQASVNIDYLRPGTAETHDDDRIRIAGDKGVVEILKKKACLITEEEGIHELPTSEQENIFNAFVRQIQEGFPSRIDSQSIFKVTEICIKTQQAADTKQAIKL